jgi:hypothetical protein
LRTFLARAGYGQATRVALAGRNQRLQVDALSVDQPELLLYEPEKNGRPRLAAVKYIMIAARYSRRPRTNRARHRS